MNKIEIGAVVKVGPAYRAARDPEFTGRGFYETDPWTENIYRVVAIDGNDAGLAPNMIGATEEDLVVWINIGRLEQIEEALVNSLKEMQSWV